MPAFRVLIPGLLLWLSALSAGDAVRAPASTPAVQAGVDTTLVDSVRAGEPLILTLPTRLGGRLVPAYRPVRMPAGGWFTDRTFFWRPLPHEVGMFRFEIAADLPNRPRLVTLRIVVTSPDG